MTGDHAQLRFSIQTKDLNLWYGDFQALKNVRVDIRQGLITALIGPSGCGKTTLLRSANRLNEQYGNVTTTGEIRILGRNIYQPGVSLGELRKTVGMVFQRPNPLPISIYENVVLVCACTMATAQPTTLTSWSNRRLPRSSCGMTSAIA